MTCLNLNIPFLEAISHSLYCDGVGETVTSIASVGATTCDMPNNYLDVREIQTRNVVVVWRRHLPLICSYLDPGT